MAEIRDVLTHTEKPNFREKARYEVGSTVYASCARPRPAAERPCSKPSGRRSWSSLTKTPMVSSSTAATVQWFNCFDYCCRAAQIVQDYRYACEERFQRPLRALQLTLSGHPCPLDDL